jgi:hypothetical protein
LVEAGLGKVGLGVGLAELQLQDTESSRARLAKNGVDPSLQDHAIMPGRISQFGFALHFIGREDEPAQFFNCLGRPALCEKHFAEPSAQVLDRFPVIQHFGGRTLKLALVPYQLGSNAPQISVLKELLFPGGEVAIALFQGTRKV